MAGNDLKLYAVLVGGKHARASIELHDIQFVVARSIEETVPALRERWWGIPASLHIDAYAELRVVDGVTITPVPRTAPAATNGVALYFVNTGGYEDGVFNELHAYSFHVSKDKKAVWAEAKRRANTFDAPHQDNFEIVDDIICVDDVIQDQDYTLTYERASGSAQPGPNIVAKYIKL